MTLEQCTVSACREMRRSPYPNAVPPPIKADELLAMLRALLAT